MGPALRTGLRRSHLLRPATGRPSNAAHQRLPLETIIHVKRERIVEFYAFVADRTSVSTRPARSR